MDDRWFLFQCLPLLLAGGVFNLLYLRGMKWLPLYLFLLGLLPACSTDVPGANDGQPPFVEILSPGNNQVYNGGDDMMIQAKVIDNDYISGIHIHIYDNSGKIYDEHIFPATDSITLHRSFKTTANTFYRIDVIANDRRPNEGRATVRASAN